MTERRPPRRIRPLSGLAALAAAILATACGFDSSANGAPPPTDKPGDPDASPVLPVDAAPGSCAEPIRTQMLVGGQSPEDGADPIATVILGDTLVMSAAGSCSNRGTLSYDWQLGDLAATADPGTDSEGLTIYPTEPGDFPITLTLSDEVGSDDPITVNLRVLRWERVAEGLNVRDVAVGAGRIWIATNVGPRFVDLSNLGAGAQDLNNAADGIDLPEDDFAAVFFDPDDGLVWFGRTAEDDTAFRLDLESFSFATVPFPSPSIGPTTVRDITTQGNGVMYSTQDGVTIAADNQTFAEPIDPGDRHAVGDNEAGGWAGSNALVRLSDGEEFTPFGAGPNAIRAIAGDDDLLWIGGDDKGVARMNADLSFDVFRTDDGLPGNRVRGLAVDGDHDVWAATQTGAGRYKRDRGVWVAMGEEAGLDDLTDLLSIATGVQGGRTVVVVGGAQGLAILGP